MLAPLLSYHRRESKVSWWRHYDQLAMSPEELERDTYALGPLEMIGAHEEGRRTIERYRFEPQEHRIGIGDTPLDPEVETRRAPTAGDVIELDSARGTITLSRTAGQARRGPVRFLIPTTPFSTDAQEESLLDLGSVGRRARPGCARLQPRRSRPAHASAAPTERRELRLRASRSGETAADQAIRLILDLHGGCLPVQGPPGAGKTYMAALAALRLIAQRRTPVGITATTHNATGTLLAKIEELAPSLGMAVRMQHRRPDGGSTSMIQVARTNDIVEAAVDGGTVDVVGGTPWLFARPEFAGRFDTLIVDEAGQMSLSDALAVSRAGHNLVLVGDPRQLAQPLQGSHPPGVGVSALDHLLGGDVTIAPERGVLLDRTWRMHPDVTAFVSRSFYEGRLGTEPRCETQAVIIDGATTTGLRTCFVGHQGDRVRSEAEAACVRSVISHLTGATWRDDSGRERPMSLEDIVVVAPYNAQVACLVEALQPGARVGTVDRFQGQEAAVSIFSMATSSVDDLPRNLEFLFSLNRLNVAVSRARGLSVLVCSPELLRARCHTPEQMRLVNALCCYVDMADPWGVAPPDAVMLPA